MNREKSKKYERGRRRRFITVFLAVNLLAIIFIVYREKSYVKEIVTGHAADCEKNVSDVMENYRHSFKLFAQMMAQEIQNRPDPDDIWDYLKSIDTTMMGIEGDTFDGLYMYYKGRYLYSWDTPYSEYEDTGYDPKERPWYKNAVAAEGEIVFTPPYMSYANHYILSTISQLQPDGETVFAYDIKMGDIQQLVTAMRMFGGEQIMIFDGNGTIIGSSHEKYLGGSLTSSPDEAEETVRELERQLNSAAEIGGEKLDKLKDELDSAAAFLSFRESFDQDLQSLLKEEKKVLSVKLDGKQGYGYLMDGEEYRYLIFVPAVSMLKDTMQIWLLPLLLVELLLVYTLGRISKEQKNNELKAAYIELGQTQKRLEIALSAAQKAAAIDDLTGLMNFHSFRKGVSEILDSMGEGETGILIMIDGDHFKLVNDNYGHQVGDEVIKLSAQMIIGRIRTIDLASRLHGDEFAIFVCNTSDYQVAKRIMEDINSTLKKESDKRNMPSITISSGAVIARHGDSYTALAKAADAALYKAKETHNGGFAAGEISPMQ